MVLLFLKWSLVIHFYNYNYPAVDFSYATVHWINPHEPGGDIPDAEILPIRCLTPYGSIPEYP